MESKKWLGGKTVLLSFLHHFGGAWNLNMYVPVFEIMSFSDMEFSKLCSVRAVWPCG